MEKKNKLFNEIESEEQTVSNEEPSESEDKNENENSVFTLCDNMETDIPMTEDQGN